MGKGLKARQEALVTRANGRKLLAQVAEPQGKKIKGQD